MQAWLAGGFYGTRERISVFDQYGFVRITKNDFVPAKALSTVQLDSRWRSYYNLAIDTPLSIDLDVNIQLTVLNTVDR